MLRWVQSDARGVALMGVAWHVRAAAVVPSNAGERTLLAACAALVQERRVRIAFGGGVFFHWFVDEQHCERCREHDRRCRTDGARQANA